MDRPRPTAFRASLRRLAALALLAWGLALTAVPAPAVAEDLVFSLQQGILDDARVKKALVVGVDWHGLSESGGVPAEAVILRDGSREDTLERSRPDPEAARRLLAEAGAGRQQPVPIIVFYEAPLEKTADLLLRALKSLGLNAQKQPVTPQTLDKAIAATRFVTGRQTIELPYILLTLQPHKAPPPSTAQLPDLVVLGPPEAAYDERRHILTVVVTVANRGRAPAGPHRLGVGDLGRTLRLPTIEIDGLAPREKREFKTGIEVPDHLLGRDLQLVAVIDISDKVREADEHNNRSEVLRFALPVPQPEPQPEPRGFVDLIVAGAPQVRFDPERHLLTAEVVVANLGNQEAGEHRLVLIDRSGAIDFPPLTLAGLGPREKQSFTFQARVPDSALGRTLVLQAVTDSDGVIAESEEGNNRGDALQLALPAPEPVPEPAPQRETPPLPIPRPERQPQPEPQPVPEPQRLADLAITTLKIATRDDGGATVVIAVANYGEAASMPTDVEVNAEGAGAWQRLPLRALNPGEALDIVWSLPAAGGALPALGERRISIAVTVDPDNRVAESLETNNARRQTASLPAPLRNWLTVAVAAVVVLVGVPLFLLLLRRLLRKSGPKPVPLRLSYKARCDPGTSTIDRSGGEPALQFRLSLRPGLDPGRQSVVLEAP